MVTSTSTSSSPGHVNFSMSGVSLMRYSSGSTCSRAQGKGIEEIFTVHINTNKEINASAILDASTTSFVVTSSYIPAGRRSAKRTKLAVQRIAEQRRAKHTQEPPELLKEKEHGSLERACTT